MDLYRHLLPVVLVVWSLTLLFFVLSIVLSPPQGSRSDRRRRRRRHQKSSSSSSSSDTSSSSDSDVCPPPRPGPPPTPRPSPEVSPGPPPAAIANVFGYSYTDPTATGILSQPQPVAPVVVTPHIMALQPTTIAVPGPNSHAPFNPNSVAATFTYNYRYVVSVSQAPATSPFDPLAPVGWINVIDPTTDTVVSTTPIANSPSLPGAQVFSVVSVNTTLSSILVGINYTGSVKDFTLNQYDMTSADSGVYSLTLFGTANPDTQLTDLRTSPDGQLVLYTLTDPTLNDVRIWKVSTIDPFFAFASTTVELQARYGAVPPPDNVAISGAWTPDSGSVVISTGAGNVPDTVILYTVGAGGTMLSPGSARSVVPQSPPSTPLKIVVAGSPSLFFFVGRTGSSLLDRGSLSALVGDVDSGTTLLAADDGFGIQDIVSSPDQTNVAALYDSGRRVELGTFTAPPLPIVPGSRLAFSRDSSWVFVGSGNVATSPANVVQAVDAVVSGPIVILGPTDPQTYFLTGTSSADASGGGGAAVRGASAARHMDNTKIPPPSTGLFAHR